MRCPEGAQDREVIGSLDDVGLALTIVAVEHRQAIAGDQRQRLEVPPAFGPQLTDPHRSRIAPADARSPDRSCIAPADTRSPDDRVGEGELAGALRGGVWGPSQGPHVYN